MTILFLSVPTSEVAKYLELRDQPGLFRPAGLGFVFSGQHGVHYLSRTADSWTCDCSSYQSLGWCCHVKALHYQLEHAFPISMRGRADPPADLPADFMQAALAGG